MSSFFFKRWFTCLAKNKVLVFWIE